MIAPLYRIHVVAERVGMSEALIRAWERRYQVLEPRRTPGGYRAYTDVDVAVLQRLKAMTEKGISIAEAARHARQLRKEVIEGAAQPAPAAPDVGADQLEQWKAEIFAAALAFDQSRVEVVLDAALSTLPALLVFEKLLVPVQIEVGDRWHAGEFSVAEEHLVSQAISTRLLALLSTRPRRGARHVVCACFPDEEHSIGLVGAALRFRDAGFRVTWLGPRTPAQDLGLAIARRDVDLVALSAHNDLGKKVFRQQLAQLIKALPKGMRVVVGGAAAERHAEAALELGAQLVRSAEEWAALFSSVAA